MFIGVGFILYFLITIIDRFMLSIPDIIYIPAAILGITLILIGIFQAKKKEYNFQFGR